VSDRCTTSDSGSNGRFAELRHPTGRLVDQFLTVPPRIDSSPFFHRPYYQAQGSRTGERTAPLYENASGYPVFFVWHAWPDGIIGTNLRESVEEKIVRACATGLPNWPLGKARKARRVGSAFELRPCLMARKPSRRTPKDEAAPEPTRPRPPPPDALARGTTLQLKDAQ